MKSHKVGSDKYKNSDSENPDEGYEGESEEQEYEETTDQEENISDEEYTVEEYTDLLTGTTETRRVRRKEKPTVKEQERVKQLDIETRSRSPVISEKGLASEDEDEELDASLEYQRSIYPLLRDNELESHYSPLKPKQKLKITPETILAEVYRMKKIQEDIEEGQYDFLMTSKKREDNDNLQKRTSDSILTKLEKRYGKKEAAIIEYTFKRIFYGEEKEEDKEFANLYHHYGVRENDLQPAQTAYSLHQRLARDVLNGKPKRVIRLTEQIEQFNDYMKYKKWPITGRKTTVVGNTILSSLEFKNYLVQQKCFQDLLRIRNDKILEDRFKPIIDTLLNDIYTAKDDKWLETWLPKARKLYQEFSTTNDFMADIKREKEKNVEHYNAKYLICESIYEAIKYRERAEKFHEQNNRKNATKKIVGCRIDRNIKDVNRDDAIQDMVIEEGSPRIVHYTRDNAGNKYDHYWVYGIENGVVSRRQVTDAKELKILKSLPLYRDSLKESEMSDELKQIINSVHQPKRVTFYLNPPKELKELKKNASKKLLTRDEKEVIAKYDNCAFLDDESNSIYLVSDNKLSKQMEGNKKISNQIKEIFADDYNKQFGNSGIVMLASDFNDLCANPVGAHKNVILEHVSMMQKILIGKVKVSVLMRLVKFSVNYSIQIGKTQNARNIQER